MEKKDGDTEECKVGRSDLGFERHVGAFQTRKQLLKGTLLLGSPSSHGPGPAWDAGKEVRGTVGPRVNKGLGHGARACNKPAPLPAI